MLPIFATLVAVGVDGSWVFFILTALNAMALGGVMLVERENRMARQLLLVTFAALAAAIPREWASPAAVEFNREKFIGAAAATYLLLCAVLSRNPKVGLAGAFAAALAGGMLRGEHGDTFHWALQSGLVFFLLHSLRWQDHEDKGVAGVRIFIGALWILESFVWARTGAPFWQPISTAMLVLCVCGLRGYVFKKWAPLTVPVAGVLAALCSPVNLAAVQLQTTPVGIVAIIASFLLFGAGTVAALTRHHWHKHEPH
jgi:hypothetical protein